MVGYRPDETITAQEKLLASSMSGFATRAVTQPLDVVKLRVQLQRAKRIANLRARPKSLRTARKILQEEGLAAFWQGHKLGQIHTIIALSCQFQFFDLATRILTTHTNLFETHRTVSNYLCGWFSGICSAVVVNPLEVIRMRQMIMPQQYSGVCNGFRQVYKTGGVKAFYSGLTASIMQMGPAVGIAFGVFSNVQPIVIKAIKEGHMADFLLTESTHMNEAKTLVIASTIAGSAAGLVSKTITYPFDLAKRRLQMASHKTTKGIVKFSTSKNLIKCKSLMECLIKSVKKDGFTGLFNGLTVTLYKAQVTNIVAFTTYETICYALRYRRLFEEGLPLPKDLVEEDSDTQKEGDGGESKVRRDSDQNK